MTPRIEKKIKLQQLTWKLNGSNKEFKAAERFQTEKIKILQCQKNTSKWEYKEGATDNSHSTDVCS